VVWLAGSVKGRAARRGAARAWRPVALRVAVGTHALFQEACTSRGWALVIVDEQHRFGVHQRLALREKGGPPASARTS
jgi:ATP-dependent DNA helicase RecG